LITKFKLFNYLPVSSDPKLYIVHPRLPNKIQDPDKLSPNPNITSPRKRTICCLVLDRKRLTSNVFPGTRTNLKKTIADHKRTKANLTRTKINYTGTKSNYPGTKANYKGTKANLTRAKTNYTRTKSN